MTSKSDKEKKGPKKSVPQSAKENPKASAKPKKKDEDDEDDEDIDFDEPKTPAKKSAKSSSSKSKKDEDDDDDMDDDVDEVDDWEKVEEEEEWDPDFDEFDVPKSKTKKSSGSAPGKKPGGKGADDDLGLDDDFKDLDLFGEGDFDEEDDDF